MPELFVNDVEKIRHTDDMQDIITAVPSWILRWGITMFFVVLVLIFSLSAFIRYPDIVKTSIKIESPNSAKPVVAKTPGKLVKILVAEGDIVMAGQSLAFVESTANHQEILSLLNKLKKIQQKVSDGRLIRVDFFNTNTVLEFGELQMTYQTFFQAYLSYKSAVNDGFYMKKRNYLERDLENLEHQKAQLNIQKDIQQKDYALAGEEFEMHKKLKNGQVETIAEFRDAQSKYLAKKYPLVQTDASLITADGNYASKQKEILELNNLITEEKAKFNQALNSLISQAEDWKNKYVLTAPQSGKVNYAGVVQENQVLNPNQEVFYINPGNEHFFGEMAIPQANMGKVKDGQQVLIKLRSYPYEEYGMIRGQINHISDVPYRDSVFMSKVDFKLNGATDMKKPIHLKQGMMADAEIITQDATILQRIVWNLLKLVK